VIGRHDVVELRLAHVRAILDLVCAVVPSTWSGRRAARRVLGSGAARRWVTALREVAIVTGGQRSGRERAIALGSLLVVIRLVALAVHGLAIDADRLLVHRLPVSS